MLFNSIDFAIFLSIVFFIYWFIVNRNLKLQNFFILAASYFFYGWWNWRFLFLIIISTLANYLVGQGLKKQENKIKREILIWISIFINLGLLGVFKYYNFFLDSFYNLIPGLRVVLGFNTLDIVLPLGISFYTFKALSYTIDVYKRKMKPTNDIIVFAAFVSFFPQLLAGPIEKAANLIPQFEKKRVFNQGKAVEGIRQILWGLFKKVVIADNCAVFANLIFNQSDQMPGSTLFLGAVFFTFQIYGDFSGYSDIAIGIGKLFGFDLMKNFAYPYFSRDIAEFWRRWHISLTTWFRDYLYIPLGGSRGGKWMKIRNTFTIFIVSGLWHGANWTFIIWGALNALYFIPLMILKTNRKNIDIVAIGKFFPGYKDTMSIVITFLLTTFAWIFFRAENLKHAISYIGSIFSRSLLIIPSFQGIGRTIPIICLILFLMIVEWIGREKSFALSLVNKTRSRFLRWSFYSVIIFLLGMYMQTEETPFIYFQF